MKEFLMSLKNLVFYFNLIWKDRPYDYIYLLQFLDKKLEQIELFLEDKYFGEHMGWQNDKEILKELKEIRNKLRKYVNKGEISEKEAERLFKKLGKLVPYLWD